MVCMGMAQRQCEAHRMSQDKRSVAKDERRRARSRRGMAWNFFEVHRRSVDLGRNAWARNGRGPSCGGTERPGCE